jgi:hypothetical protein
MLASAWQRGKPAKLFVKMSANVSILQIRARSKMHHHSSPFIIIHRQKSSGIVKTDDIRPIPSSDMDDRWTGFDASRTRF